MSSDFKNQIKIFLDGADFDTMVEFSENPQVKGFTTNPSLMKKAGVTDYKGFCLKVLEKIPTRPISFEVFSDEFSEMERQALEIDSWGKNVYVKIPITNSLGESCGPLIKTLTRKGIKLNVTAIFTLEQVCTACDALKDGAPSIVSTFAGRLADSGFDPMPMMKAASALCRAAGRDIEHLWASTREPFSIVQAEQCDCHIITVPGPMIKKMSLFGKDPLEYSLDTVKDFKKDSELAGFKL